MILCKVIIEQILNILSQNTDLKDIDFISEFPSERHDIPLCRVTVSVGVDALTFSPAEDAWAIVPGRGMETVKVKLMVCSPRDCSGMVCYEATDKIISALKVFPSEFIVTSIEIGQMKYSSSINGLCVPIDITVLEENAF